MHIVALTYQPYEFTVIQDPSCRGLSFLIAYIVLSHVMSYFIQNYRSEKFDLGLFTFRLSKSVSDSQSKRGFKPRMK